MKKPSIFVRGLPLKSKIKVSIVLSLIFLLVLNLTVPIIFSSLKYPVSGGVNIGLSLLIILFSIGSITAESIVLGVLVLAFFSNLWDYGIHDYSKLRNQVLVGTIVALGLTSFLGKISLTNLFETIGRQLGLKRNNGG